MCGFIVNDPCRCRSIDTIVFAWLSHKAHIHRSMSDNVRATGKNPQPCVTSSCCAHMPARRLRTAHLKPPFPTSR